MTHDEAWAAIEAALADGESVVLLSRDWEYGHDERGLPTEKRHVGRWKVYAGQPDSDDYFAEGPTARAALQALAEYLNEMNARMTEWEKPR